MKYGWLLVGMLILLSVGCSDAKKAGRRFAAVLGRAESQYELSKTETLSSKERLTWLIKAANQGLAPAQCTLGSRYKTGNGVTQSSLEALRWYHAAAEQGDGEAQYELYDAYDGSWADVSPNESQAMFWLIKTSASTSYHSIITQFVAESLLFSTNNPNINVLVDALRKCSSDNNPKALYYLGVCYENGRGVPKSLNHAISFYKKSADAGDPQAQGRLGFLYSHGEFYDFKASNKYLFMAHSNGNSWATAYIGIDFIDSGFEELGADWVQWSAEEGCGFGLFHLGDIYQKGIGVPGDYIKAYAYYYLAAKQEYKGASKAIENLLPNLNAYQIERGQELAIEFQKQYTPDY